MSGHLRMGGGAGFTKSRVLHEAISVRCSGRRLGGDYRRRGSFHARSLVADRTRRGFFRNQGWGRGMLRIVTEGAASTSTPGEAPDWSTISREIVCPLCDYNLRGLVEAWCPECGYRTTWAELVDPDIADHPWFFETCRKQKIRAMVKTLIVSQRPLRFWSIIKPTRVPRPRRIAMYWLCVAAMVVVPFIGMLAYSIGRQYYVIYGERLEWVSLPNALPLPHWSETNPAYPWRFGGPPMYPSFYAAYQEADRAMGWRETGANTTSLFILGGFLLWPWCTLMGLQIFRRTMRMRRINSPHVMRCAIYSADAVPILALLVIPIVRWRCTSVERWAHPWMLYGRIFEPVILAALCSCAMVLTARLCIAYRRYLGFPHAVGVCIAAELIVVLMLLLGYAFTAPIW